ncbi:MAG TPA: carboxylating nicotinate-nucleotide diphosphorylase [Abditibacteriaceae bacterium]|nr:carboxylating nicotinate-nucleotide diphosphorylase [Abditibacteriaceae bacterium]
MDNVPPLALPDFLIAPLIEAALHEDIRSGDITTAALIPAGTRSRAHMVFRESGIVCGLDVARLVFQLLDSNATVEVSIPDGATVEPGGAVLRVSGEAGAILTAERVALNFVQRLSGVATLTRRFVDAVAGTGARIADTRKTTPGLRLLEKYAVRCGGGSNHRFALDDLILIKDNHVALCAGIESAITRARHRAGHAVKIEVECDTLEQVREAVAARADIVLLDNMTPQQLRDAVQIIAGCALAEASGGVNLDTVRAIAESGANLISVGALTHSVRSLDVGLDIDL